MPSPDFTVTLESLCSYIVASWNIENINQTLMTLAWEALAVKIGSMRCEMREAFVEECDDG